MKPNLIRALCLMFPALVCASEVTPFDSKLWQEDLEQAREAVATKYANLEWLVFEREVDLTALFTEAKSSIDLAASAEEARAAFDRLARKFGDAHVRFRWPSVQGAPDGTITNCASLGYDSRTLGTPVATFIAGYKPVANSSMNVFPAGTLRVRNHRIGVIGIARFMPQGYPELCEAALPALHTAPDTPCNAVCSQRISDWISDRMSRDLESQLGALKAAGADVLLVDIANNGGGTDWAEAVARMMTPITLRSERIGYVRGAHWADSFAEMELDLRAAINDSISVDRALLAPLADAVALRRKEAEIPCDSSPLWRGEKLTCEWLGDGFFGSGLLGSGDIQRFQGKSWAEFVFKPGQYPVHQSVWTGPLVILVNGSTGSAAEQFAAVLQDNHAAIVIGSPTVGAGCGHTNGGTPTTLSNSGGVLELPDCARFRADGSNEVMGIQPDVLVGLRVNDGPHRQGIRVAARLSDAVALAIKQHRWHLGGSVIYE